MTKLIKTEKKLSKYFSIRNENKTPEPFSSKNLDPKKLFFVVQKHRATALHWDFRLELEGVLVSWAIPKGPSLDPKIKRLAMQTEDHPIDYCNFEGTIPKGEYGGGEVIIWDEGAYFAEVENEKNQRVKITEKKEAEKVMESGIKRGEIKFFMNGKRLKGSFALVKTRGFGGKGAWLFIKHRDEFVVEGFDAKSLNTSVVSGKTLD